jgi:hypothetical protein
MDGRYVGEVAKLAILSQIRRQDTYLQNLNCFAVPLRSGEWVSCHRVSTGAASVHFAKWHYDGAPGLRPAKAIWDYRRERARPGSGISLSNPLNQPGAFDCRWIVGATSGAAVVPNPYRLQAGNADDTTSFENYPMFHTASLERPPRDGNGRFGAGNEPSRSAVWLVPAQAVRRNGQHPVHGAGQSYRLLQRLENAAHR